MVTQSLKKFIDGLRSVAFPQVCACCGFSTAGSGFHICEWCRLQRFESPKGTASEVLPEFILHRFSMWAFDKGGMLQDLLHDLKYHHLKDVGLEMGVHLAEKYMKSPNLMREIDRSGKEPLLVPVPLHRKKERKRGYNQARVLADGISKRTGWPVIREKTVVRVKNTKTQTGLSSSERQRNLDGAFKLLRPINHNQIPVLVDDVFTTGATTFELARVLNATESRKVVILTVASA
jgi:ComF family protein